MTTPQYASFSRFLAEEFAELQKRVVAEYQRHTAISGSHSAACTLRNGNHLYGTCTSDLADAATAANADGAGPRSKHSEAALSDDRAAAALPTAAGRPDDGLSQNATASQRPHSPAVASGEALPEARSGAPGGQAAYASGHRPLTPSTPRSAATASADDAAGAAAGLAPPLPSLLGSHGLAGHAFTCGEEHRAMHGLTWSAELGCGNEDLCCQSLCLSSFDGDSPGASPAVRVSITPVGAGLAADAAPPPAQLPGGPKAAGGVEAPPSPSPEARLEPQKPAEQQRFLEPPRRRSLASRHSSLDGSEATTCSRRAWMCGVSYGSEDKVRLSNASGLTSEGGLHHFVVLPLWSKHRRTSLMKSLTYRQKTVTFDDAPADSDEQQTTCLLVKPGSTANIVWDMLGLFLIVWDCFMIPLAFFSPPENFMASSLIGWIARVYWTLNIPAGFLTGYVDRTGKLVMSKAKVAKRYAATWLSFDGVMMCSDWLELTVRDGGDGMQYHRIGIAFRSLRMIRTVRLLRMIRAPVLSSQLSESIMCEELMLVSHILKIMALLLGAAHLVACVWYGIGIADADSGWVRSSSVRDSTLWPRYVFSLHWTLSMFLGETLVDSESLRERCFAVAILFFGFIFSSSLVSSLTTAMTRLQMLSSQQSVHMSQLRRFLVNRGISRPLALRVQRNAQHILMERKQNMPEASVELLQIISDPLKVEIHFEVYSDLLTAHPLFCCFRSTNPAGIRKVCHTCVTLVSLSAGDILFSELELPTQPRMFIVKSGRTSYQQELGDEEQNLHHAQWLCEQVLWTTWAHCGTFRAVTDSVLLALDAERFQSIFTGSSDSHLTRYAEAFVLALNRVGEGNLTDLGSADAELAEIIAYAFPELQPEIEDEDPDSPRSSVGSFGVRRASWLLGRGNSSLGRARSPPGGEAGAAAGVATRAAAAVSARLSGLWDRARLSTPGLRRSASAQTGDSVQPFGVAPLAASS